MALSPVASGLQGISTNEHPLDRANNTPRAPAKRVKEPITIRKNDKWPRNRNCADIGDGPNLAHSEVHRCPTRSGWFCPEPSSPEVGKGRGVSWAEYFSSSSRHNSQSTIEAILCLSRSIVALCCSATSEIPRSILVAMSQPGGKSPPQPLSPRWDLTTPKVHYPGRRFAQIVKLKPEFVNKYKEVHAAVWPEVLRQIRDCNIVDCTYHFPSLSCDQGFDTETLSLCE
jgi:hypothetical protein